MQDLHRKFEDLKEADNALEANYIALCKEFERAKQSLIQVKADLSVAEQIAARAEGESSSLVNELRVVKTLNAQYDHDIFDLQQALAREQQRANLLQMTLEDYGRTLEQDA